MPKPYEATIELHGVRAVLNSSGEWQSEDEAVAGLLRAHYESLRLDGEVSGWMPDPLRVAAKAAKRDLGAKIISITPPPRPPRTDSGLPPVY